MSKITFRQEVAYDSDDGDNLQTVSLDAQDPVNFLMNLNQFFSSNGISNIVFKESSGVEQQSEHKPQKDDFEFTSQTLSENEKKLLNDHFQINVFDTTPGQNFELDIDYGIQEFQKKFYAKFVALREPDELNEMSKIERFKVRVSIKDDLHVFITRRQMDHLLHKFKRVHLASLRLRNFLTHKAISFFYKVFNFDDFLILNSCFPMELLILDTGDSFDVKWKPTAMESVLVYGANNKQIRVAQKKEIDCKQTMKEYWRPESFEVVRKYTSLTESNDEMLIYFQAKTLIEFFEFMLKAERHLEEEVMVETAHS